MKLWNKSLLKNHLICWICILHIVVLNWNENFNELEKKLSVISIKQKNCLELFLLIFTSISLSPVFVLFLPVFLQSLRVENNPALNRHFIVKEQIKSQKHKNKTLWKENLVGVMFSTRPSCAKHKIFFFRKQFFLGFLIKGEKSN